MCVSLRRFPSLFLVWESKEAFHIYLDAAEGEEFPSQPTLFFFPPSPAPVFYTKSCSFSFPLSPENGPSAKGKVK